MNRALPLCVGFLMLLSPLSVGQAAEDGGGKAYEPCDLPYVEPTLKCLKATLETQDAALNVAYKKLYSIMTPFQKGLLLKAERAWIQYRDAECDFRGAQLIYGAALGDLADSQAVDKANCLVQLTHDRLEALNTADKDARMWGKQGG